MDILDKIQQEIKQDYYTQYFSNEFVNLIGLIMKTHFYLQTIQHLKT